MRCEGCGAEVDQQSTFCSKCGQRVAGDDQGSVVEKTPAQRIRGAAGSADGDEHKLWKGSYSGKAMIGSWVLAGLLTVVAAVVGIVTFPSGIGPVIAAAVVVATWLFLGGLLLLRKIDVHYELTTQRLIHRSGILTRTIDRIELIDMDDVNVEQGLIQRMVNVGTIRILSSDASHPNLAMRGIDNVESVADVIDNARRDERRRRGLHIEAI